MKAIHKKCGTEMEELVDYIPTEDDEMKITIGWRCPKCGETIDTHGVLYVDRRDEYELIEED